MPNTRRYDTLHLARGVGVRVAAKTAAYTATTEDVLVTGDATSAAFSVTLPAIADAYDADSDVGQVIAIKKIDSGANAVTIDGSGSETIDGATTLALPAQYDTALLVAGASEWHRLTDTL